MLDDFSIYVSDAIPGTMLYLPHIVVTVPLIEGLTELEVMRLAANCWGNEMIAAARHGEVGIIKNMKVGQ